MWAATLVCLAIVLAAINGWVVGVWLGRALVSCWDYISESATMELSKEEKEEDL